MKRSTAALAVAAVVLTGPAVGAQELASRLFLAADRDHDRVLTRAELEATLESWAAVAPDAFADAIEGALPRLPQNQTPKPEDVAAMVAALPDKAPAKPRAPRRVLVLGRAAGYVHSSIPLAARTIEEARRRAPGPPPSPTTPPTSTRRTSRPTTPSSWPAPPASSSTIRRTPPPPRRAARRCSTSCAAAKAWRAFTRRAIPIIGARRRPAAEPSTFRSCRS